MPQFIYNRTQDHVDRLKALQAKGYPNLTDDELAEYTGYAALGAYNATDINRVEAAVAEIASLYGLTLTTNTNRTYWTTPNRYAGGFYTTQYLNNVVAIRDAALALDGTLVFPDLPESMDNLTWELANNIEETLYLAYTAYLNVYGGTLEWDGDTTNLEYTTYSPIQYKVSNAVLTMEDVERGVSVWVVYYGKERLLELSMLNIHTSGGALCIDTDLGFYVTSVDETTAEKLEYPSAGTYFSYSNPTTYVCKLVVAGYTGFWEGV